MSRPRKPAELTDLQQQVLRVLAGQSPDYLIAPHATAFYVEGLEPDVVERTLLELEAAGAVTYLEMQGDVVDTRTGEPVYVTEQKVVEVETTHVDVDEDGEPVLDSKGKPKVTKGKREQVLDVPVLDDAGEPIPLVIDLDNGWTLTDVGRPIAEPLAQDAAAYPAELPPGA